MSSSRQYWNCFELLTDNGNLGDSESRSIVTLKEDVTLVDCKFEEKEQNERFVILFYELSDGIKNVPARKKKVLFSCYGHTPTPTSSCPRKFKR